MAHREIDLDQSQRKVGASGFEAMSGWENISTAPFDRDLQLAVVSGDDAHALMFPCRRTSGGWIDSETKAVVEVYPTHWRDWKRDA